MKTFKTPDYHGVWLDFGEDRMAFRALIEKYLQTTLLDPDGKLVVDEKGPHWKGSLKLGISYSHTLNIGILVYSTTHDLGVDIESEKREFNSDPINLATRFFPATEGITLSKLPKDQQKSEFLKLWVQKEAYAKLTRLGLAKTLELGIQPSRLVETNSLPLAPDGFFSCILKKEFD